MVRTDGIPTIASGRDLSGFRVENHGSIFLVEPLDASAQAWLDENVDLDGAQFLGRALAVEHRYAYDLVDGILDEGFAVC